MILFKLAYRNIKGAGLRTWLNVAVLSFVYVLIIWHQGIFNGMLKQGTKEMVDYEIGKGQYWLSQYDPYDPLTFDDSHGVIPEPLTTAIHANQATPILIRQAAIFPEGRIQTILLKGIDPNQTLLKIPAAVLKKENNVLPVLIGKRMAKNNSYKMGDMITIRWRDVHGTFDAVEGEIVGIMNTNVPTVDNNQLWIPLDRLQQMTGLQNEATIIIVGNNYTDPADIAHWDFKSQDYLLSDLHEIVKSKRISSGILYAILLFLAMLAIFDTQVLAIFRRRKEIGTLISLGMTRIQVIALFTIEGAMHGILAIAAASVYGIPWIYYFAKTGMRLPQVTENYGFALTDRLYPSYSVALVVGTIVLVMVIVTIVSFLPSRRIAKLNPVDALKGKLA